MIPTKLIVKTAKAMVAILIFLSAIPTAYSAFLKLYFVFHDLTFIHMLVLSV